MINADNFRHSLSILRASGVQTVSQAHAIAHLRAHPSSKINLLGSIGGADHGGADAIATLKSLGFVEESETEFRLTKRGSQLAKLVFV